MKDQALPIIAIVVSVTAMIVSLAHKKGRDPSRGAVEAASLDRIERRLRQLESELDARNGNKPRRLSSLTDSAVILGEDRSLAELRGKQAQLEAELTELGVFDHFETQKAKIEESYLAVLDPKQSPKNRLTALGTLREAKRIDNAVVSSMVTMWDESIADEKGGGWTRWALMENLEGIRDPAFRDSILEWLPEEESPKMRGQAIETLASMMPDTNVEQWLDYLGENDPEPKIRELATAIRRNAAADK